MLQEKSERELHDL